MLMKHGTFYLAARIVPALSSIVALALFARILGPSEYGRYALIVTYAGGFGAAMFGWLALGVGRFLPDFAARSEADRMLRTVLAALLGFGALGAVIAVVVPSVFRPAASVSTGVVLIALVAFSQAWFNVNLRVANSFLRPGSYFVLTASRSLLFLVSGLLAAAAGLGATGLLISMAFSLLVVPLVTTRAWKGNWHPALDTSILRRLLTYGMPLALTFVFGYVIDSSDRLFLAAMIGPKAVGLYSAPYDLVQYGVGSVASAVNLASYPIVVNALAHKGKHAADRELRRTSAMLIAVIVPVALTFVILGRNIGSVFLGPAFAPVAERVMPFVAVAIAMSALRGFYFDYAFHLSTATLRLTASLAAGALVNAALNWSLIPTLGVEGAALSTLAAFAVALGVSRTVGRSVYTLPSIGSRDTLRVMVAGAVMAVPLVLLRGQSGVPGLALQTVSGVLAYAAACYAMDVLGVRHLVNVRVRSLRG